MPGAIAIDTKSTFAAAIFLGASQKMLFGTDQPDVAKDGQRKFAADVAVTYHAEPGRKPVSEVISVSVLGTDPAATITAGSPVEFDGLTCGVMAPQRNERGGVSGGKLYFMARAIRASAPVNGRPLAAAKSE